MDASAKEALSSLGEGPALLKPYHGFAIQQNTPNTLFYFDEDRLIFSIGQYMMLYHVDSRESRFLCAPDLSSKGILAASLTPNKRWMAVSNREQGPGGINNSNNLSVSIWNLATERRHKHLQSSSLREVVALAWAEDNSAILTLSSAPTWTLAVWPWDASAPSATVALGSEITTIGFHPLNPSIIYAAGPSFIRQFKLTPGTEVDVSTAAGAAAIAASNPGASTAEPWHLRSTVPGTLRRDQLRGKYVHHIWLCKNTVLAILDAMGSVILISIPLKHVPGVTTAVLHLPSAQDRRYCRIASVSQGFVVAASDGSLHMYGSIDAADAAATGREGEISVGRYVFVHERSIEPPQELKAPVNALAVAPSESRMYISYTTGDLASLSLALADLDGSAAAAHVPQGTGLDHGSLFSVAVEGGFHSETVTATAIATRKPLMASVAADGALKIWNYAERLVTHHVQFDKDSGPLSIAMAPDGHHIYVGLPDRLRRYAIVVDQALVPDGEFIVKSARTLALAHGGHIIAAVSGAYTYLFNVYTGTSLGSLKGHSGPVKALSWSPDDTVLVSAGFDGAVFEWNVQSRRRLSEHVLKTCQYTSVVLGRPRGITSSGLNRTGAQIGAEASSGSGKSRDKAARSSTTPAPVTPSARGSTISAAGEVILASGSDRVLRELRGGTTVQEVALKGVRYTHLLMSSSGRTVFAATDSGQVHVYPYPLAGTAHIATPLHGAPITSMSLSRDDLLLVTGASDGSVVLSQVQPLEFGIPRPLKTLDAQAGLDEHILIASSVYSEAKRAIMDLHQRIEELGAEHQAQLAARDTYFSKAAAAAKADAEEAAQAAERRFQEMKIKLEAQEMEASDVVQQLESEHVKAVARLERLYARKLSAEAGRTQAALKQRDDLKCVYEEKLHAKDKNMSDQMELLTAQTGEQVTEAEREVRELEAQLERVEIERNEALRQVEEESETHVTLLQEASKKELQIERDTASSLKGEAAVLRRQFEAFQAKGEKNKSEIARRDATISQLRGYVDDLEKNVAVLKREIRERNETVGAKERRIYELKQKNQELEKFRFVLDFKIAELTGEVEPRDAAIAEMRIQIKAMDEELKRVSATREQLEILLRDKHEKLSMLSKEASRCKTTADEKTRFAKSILDDLSAVYHHADPKSWRGAFRRLYATYAGVDEGELLQHVGDAGGMARARQRSQASSKDREMSRQRKYMEHSLDSVKSNAAMANKRMQAEWGRKLNENSALLTEVNSLRRRNKELTTRLLQLTKEHGKARVRDSYSDEEDYGMENVREWEAAAARVEGDEGGESDGSEGSEGGEDDADQYSSSNHSDESEEDEDADWAVGAASHGKGGLRSVFQRARTGGTRAGPGSIVSIPRGPKRDRM